MEKKQKKIIEYNTKIIENFEISKIKDFEIIYLYMY